MHDFIKKLWNSKSTLIIVLWVIVFAYVYNLGHSKKPVIHPTPSASKTLEQIMAGPIDNSPEPAWDTDFKSAIREAE